LYYVILTETISRPIHYESGWNEGKVPFRGLELMGLGYSKLVWPALWHPCQIGNGMNIPHSHMATIFFTCKLISSFWDGLDIPQIELDGGQEDFATKALRNYFYGC
jgi:hypothetical protein